MTDSVLDSMRVSRASSPKDRDEPGPPARRLALALQGGGAHGAFTWGVLDAILAQTNVEIDAVSGASAGAINAVLLAYGLTTGGREGARALLNEFWSELPQHSLPGGVLTAQPLAALTRWFSPYQLNPFDFNPLRKLLARLIDFERLRRDCTLPVILSATRIDAGRLRLFRTRELTLDVLVASCALPGLHHAVTIEGEAYWDGGFTANPPLTPLLADSRARDLLLVVLQPRQRSEVPTSADAISQRAAEIAFGAAYHAELRALQSARRLARRQWLALDGETRRLRALRVHMIDGGSMIDELPATTRLAPERDLLQRLHEHGLARGQNWLRRRAGAGEATLLPAPR